MDGFSGPDRNLGLPLPGNLEPPDPARKLQESRAEEIPFDQLFEAEMSDKFKDIEQSLKAKGRSADPWARKESEKVAQDEALRKSDREISLVDPRDRRPDARAQSAAELESEKVREIQKRKKEYKGIPVPQEAPSEMRGTSQPFEVILDPDRYRKALKERADEEGLVDPELIEKLQARGLRNPITGIHDPRLKEIESFDTEEGWRKERVSDIWEVAWKPGDQAFATAYGQSATTGEQGPLSIQTWADREVQRIWVRDGKISVERSGLQG